MNPTFRFATRTDSALILDFIKQLAEYERLQTSVVATETMLEEWIFDNHAAEVLFILENDTEIGFALFFQNFSTFLGRPGLHLEDLFILPEHRGKGYGKATLQLLAQIALDRGYGRFEWNCLDWNTPSINFYLSLGAEQMHEWTTYRIAGEKLTELAGLAEKNL